MTHSLRISEPTGDETKVRTVYVNDVEAGVIIGHDPMVVWEPAKPMPFGLDIAGSMTMSHDSIIDFLEHLIDRQMTAISHGQKPDVNTLHPDLRTWMFKGPLGPMLKHPLVFDMIVSPATHARINAYYKYKRDERERMLKAKEWHKYVWIHERAHRLDAFSEIQHNLKPIPYWELLGSLWTDSDNIYQNFDAWKYYWHVDHPYRHRIMDADERKQLRAMPETFEIYRGVRHKKSIRGLSWTIDKNRAIWFANRYAGTTPSAYLATATVSKSNVLAYFTGRNEKEIVITPEKCGKIDVITL